MEMSVNGRVTEETTARDVGTKRQRIEHLIQRGDRLANAQQEQQSEAVCEPRKSSSSSATLTCANGVVSTVRRSSWTAQEDAKLRKLVQELGSSNWSEIASFFPSRDRKRCRERFVNHLAPTLSSPGTWTQQDDQKLMQLQREKGSKWTQIAKDFRGRSPESVKNRCLMLARRTHSQTERKAPTQRWTVVEKDKLRTLVATHGARNWLFIASQLPGRTDLQCLQQWYRTLDEKVVKGKGTWTEKEDRVLVEKVAEIGRKWTEVAAFLPGRIGNQCRERFLNNLDTSNSMDSWTESEEVVLTEAVRVHSTQWRLIAQKLPGRCENAIKNHWYARERKRMLAECAESGAPNE